MKALPFDQGGAEIARMLAASDTRARTSALELAVLRFGAGTLALVRG